MRSVKDLLKEIRRTAAADRILIPGQGGRQNRAWPICVTCGREPFFVNQEDKGNMRVDVRVKCGHKPYYELTKDDRVYEEVATIDLSAFGSNSEERDEHIGWCLRSIRWFSPENWAGER